MVIVCDKEMALSVLGYNPVRDRIISIRIKGKSINMTFIQCCAPTTNAEEIDIEEFYEVLQETMD